MPFCYLNSPRKYVLSWSQFHRWGNCDMVASRDLLKVIKLLGWGTKIHSCVCLAKKSKLLTGNVFWMPRRKFLNENPSEHLGVSIHISHRALLLFLYHFYCNFQCLQFYWGDTFHFLLCLFSIRASLGLICSGNKIRRSIKQVPFCKFVRWKKQGTRGVREAGRGSQVPEWAGCRGWDRHTRSTR